MPSVSAQEWQAFLCHHPEAHLLQLEAWGDIKSRFGWNVERIVSGNAGAQILFKHLPPGLSLAYIPKGPVGSDYATLWSEIDHLCKAKHAIMLKVEPDLWEPLSPADDAACFSGFRPGQVSIQPPRTILIDLRGSLEEILGRMKQKTRYNIHLAEKKGVEVHPSSDFDTFFRLISLTSQRDGFGVHTRDYYESAFKLFAPLGLCTLLQADYHEQPLAALMVFAAGKRAWYLYGASNDQERNRMPAYLLQWQAMLWARQRGCLEYDLWGIPDYDEQILESQFEKRHDGLWGVYRFKRGFGGRITRSVSAFDRVYMPAFYALYRWWIGRQVGGL
jgi:peptidoglycan pentaglycine glycine transferase (the first glycine)